MEKCQKWCGTLVILLLFCLKLWNICYFGNMNINTDVSNHLERRKVESKERESASLAIADCRAKTTNGRHSHFASL